MATRFYFHSGEAAEVSVTPDAAWDDTSSPAIQRRMGPVKKVGDTMTTLASLFSTTGQDRLHYQGVSDPLPAGVTFDTGVTYKCYLLCLEGAGTDNVVTRMGVRIVSRDGATVQHTVLAVANYGNATEMNTTLRNKIFANGDAGTGSYVTVDGDRLVVEIGHNDSSGTTPAAQSRFGSTSTGTDLGENETDTTTTLVPWFETSVTTTLGEWYEDFEVSPDNTTLSINNTHATTYTNAGVSDSGILLDEVGAFGAMLNAAAQVRNTQFDWLSDTDCYLRFYFRMDTLPPGTIAILEGRTTAGAAITFDVQMNTSGNLRLRNQAQVLQTTTSTALNVDVWHRLEFHFTTTQLTCRIFKDANHHGTTADEEATATLSTSGLAQVRTGVHNSTTWLIWMDEWMYSTADWVGTAFANPTPTTVAATTTIDTPTVDVTAGSADADVTPTTVVAITAIAAPSIIVDANVTPTTVATQASVDTPTVTADANVTTTTVIAQVFIDTPAVVAVRNVDITPTEVVGITAVPVPQVIGNANAPPSEVVAIAAIPTPSVTGDANLTPTTVVALTFVDTPALTADANPTAGNVAAQASVDTPSVTANADVTAGNVIAQAFVDTPTVEAGGSVAITPDTVAAQAFIPTPTVDVVQNPTVTPDTVAATTAIQIPVVTADANVTPITVPGTTAVELPGIAGNADTSAGNVAGTTTVPTPTVSGNADVTPTEVAAVTTIPGVSVSVVQNPNVTPSTVVAQAFIDSPNVSTEGNADITLATVVAQASIPGVTVATDAQVTAGDVQSLAAILVPSVTADANVTTSTIAAQATIPGVTVTILASGDTSVTPDTVVAQAQIPGVMVSIAPPWWEQTDGDGWPQTNEDVWPQTNEPAWSSSSGVGYWPQTNDGGWE